jgi:integrase
MGEIYLRNPVFTQPWHEEVGDLLRRRYEIAGWSRNMYMQDFSMLRVICGDKHPRDVFLQDLEEQVLKGKTQATRETYVARVKSVWNSMRMLGIIPVDHHPELGLPKVRVPRYSPRPITKDQAIMLMTQSQEPMREWFMFACLAGMRAIEVSRVRGDWLELHADGYFLRILGKGDTEILVPCHPKLVELIQSKNVLGLLYTVDNNYLSRLACAEMRRLGIMTKKNGSTASRISFHSCRHFFATTVLAASGGNLITTQRLMRHASPVVTARYADLVNGEERGIMAGLLADIDWDEAEREREIES